MPKKRITTILDELQKTLKNRGAICKTICKAVSLKSSAMEERCKGKDGITLLQEIRNEESWEHLWVVVVSANAIGEKNNDSGVALEVIDWTNKPIDQTKLMEALNKAIRMNEIQKPRILHVEDDASGWLCRRDFAIYKSKLFFNADCTFFCARS